MDDRMYKLIRKAGKCEIEARGKDKGLYTVICQGCGGVIRSDEDGPVEAVQTKRSDVWFWHSACTGKVWSGKVKWMTPEQRKKAAV